MLSLVDKDKQQNDAPWEPGNQSTHPEASRRAQPQAEGENRRGDQQGQGGHRIEKYPAGHTPNRYVVPSQGQARAKVVKCGPVPGRQDESYLQ